MKELMESSYLSVMSEQNDKLREEIKHLQSVIDKAIEVFENEIKNLKEQKRLIMNILTPENGYLKADIDCEIKRLERYLEILRSKDE